MSLIALPAKFAWADKEDGPKIWLEARKHYGILEHPGPGSNPNISQWARELGVSGWYTDDDIPWCGLFAATVVTRCGYDAPRDSLAAKSWLNFGQTMAISQASFMDVMVFQRPGGHHVSFYIGENSHAFVCYGGNQSNAVGFAGIEKSRCIGVRRCRWKIGQPANVRKIYLHEDFQLSTNEA